MVHTQSVQIGDQVKKEDLWPESKVGLSVNGRLKSKGWIEREEEKKEREGDDEDIFVNLFRLIAHI